MKANPTMLLKIKGQKMSDRRHPTMLMIIKDLQPVCHDVYDNKSSY